MAEVAITDTIYGAMRQFEVTGLEIDETYIFRIRCGTDGLVWSPVSNLVIGTANESVDTTRPAPVTGVELWSSNSTSLSVTWNTAADDSIYGEAFDYKVRYSTTPISELNWDSATECNEPVVSNRMDDRWQITKPRKRIGVHGDKLCVCAEIPAFTPGRNLQADPKILILNVVTADTLQHAVVRNPGMDVLVLGVSTKRPLRCAPGPG